MKRLWLYALVLATLTLVPARARADINVTCISASDCEGDCQYRAWIVETDPDGNTSGSFGSCCYCT